MPTRGPDVDRPSPRPRRGRRLALAAFAVLLVAAVALYLVPLRYAYLPPDDAVVNARGASSPFADVWGRPISAAEAEDLLTTERGRALLDPANGAVPITPDTLALGRAAFYQESFGNEVFLTEILGMLDGPLTPTAFAKAIWKLHGEGTTNLRVELARTVTVGGKTFTEGTLVDTGLDVAKGSDAVLGMTLRKTGGKLLAGITCAVCHSTVDPETKRVIEGAPNNDFNAGLLLALASNSAAYFVHTDVDAAAFAHDPSRTVVTSDGGSAMLPDPQALEDAVDAVLLEWPPGSFDSMTDLVADPTQIPSSFTRGAEPYGWSGFAAAGPFRGLSVLNNDVHALNSDALTNAGLSRTLFHMDPETYVGIVLQHAASRRYRFDPATKRRPSEFFASVDPTPGAVGASEVVELPTFPNGSLIAPNSVWASTRGHRVWEQVNAMSAWQNTLVPPKPPIAADEATLARGRNVFERAGCAFCHAGAARTNNLVVPAAHIGTEPARAHALAGLQPIMVDSVAFAFDQPVPLPPAPRVLPVPNQPAPEQIDLAFGWNGSGGGYKVPSLVGVYWSAPYLHDGGVAVGPDARTDVGLPGTLLKGIPPDPMNSLRAMVDRELRAKVIAANEADADLQAVHVRGIGHPYWVDRATRFSGDDQRALITYLAVAD